MILGIQDIELRKLRLKNRQHKISKSARRYAL